jgi:hypothetical protein
LLRALTVLAAVLVAGGAARPSDWRRDEPCDGELAMPRAAALDGCAAARCAAAGDGIEVCACRPLVEDDADGAGLRFTLRERGVDKRFQSPPILAAGRLYVGTSDGTMHAIGGCPP